MSSNFYQLRSASWLVRPKKEDQWDELRDIYKDLMDAIHTLDEPDAKQYLKNRMEDLGRTCANIKKLTQWQFSEENT